MHWLLLASLLAAEPAPASPPAKAATPAAPSASPQSEEERKKLEEEIAKELGTQPQGKPGQAAPAPSPPRGGGEGAGAAPAQGSQGQTGGNPFARLLLLPDLSAIGSASLSWNRLDVGAVSPRSGPFAPAHTVQPSFDELELGLQAVVDPYARADVFISFADQGVEVEEAYLTTLQLPFALQARAGKFFAPIGRINQQHGHVWDFVDRPLALARLLGVDALKGPGVDVAWLAPLPWFAELHVTYQSVTPGFETRSRNGGFARLVQFFDLSDAATLGAGLSGGLVQEGGPAGWRDVYGADVFLKLRPPQSRAYVALQGELVARSLDRTPRDAQSAFEAPGTAWGGYLQAVRRDGPYYEYGVRYERAPAVAGGAEHRVSALLGWLPSEFQRLRLQLGWDRLPSGRDGVEALLAAEFAIGAHGAHPF